MTAPWVTVASRMGAASVTGTDHLIREEYFRDLP